ncbi:MAG: hypothetical protein ACKOF9_09470 [Burkholderiales bacterium]
MKYLASLFVAALALSACGGGGGDSTPSPAPAPAPAPAGFTNVTGKITFDYVPVAVNGAGIPRLDFPSTSRREARGVLVEVLDANSRVVLASGVTNASGDYALQVPAGRSVFVRANAVLWTDSVSSPNVVEVRDNTQGNAQWAIDGAVFSTTGSSVTQNLNAPSGWSGSSYTGLRGAAPFAILDTIYTGVQKVRSAQANAVFPKLTVYWSPNNTSAAGGNLAAGQIGTSFFQTSFSSNTLQRALYILGKAENDTDEFDAHVIAHEFGHYLQSAFSRDDTTGGRHSGTDLLDMRVAFSEGWGNGWAAISLNNKIYADTLAAAASGGFSMDVSVGATSNPGWFRTRSVQRLFWDMSNSPSIGFTTVWTTMRSGLTTTPALTGIHSFAFGLAQSNPSLTSPLSAILLNQSVSLPTDAYGSGETNFGSPVIAAVNPLYLSHPGVGSTLSNVCLSNAADPDRDGNKAGEFRYVRLNLPAGPRTISVTRAATTSVATDPDFYLYSNVGQVSNGSSTFGLSAVANSESAQISVNGGNYVLAVTDYNFTTNGLSRAPCFNVLIN